MSNHYTKSKILSNSEFYYKDKQNDLPKDHIIQLNHEFEKKLEIPHQIPLGKLKSVSSVKEIHLVNPPSAFELAEEEAHKLKLKLVHKKQELNRKANLIQNIVIEREKEIKENDLKEKKELEETLILIIKDALRFSKENPPMISMMPTSLTNAINQLREDQGLKRKSNVLNISSGSLNLSFKSSNSISSLNKYQSNQFLTLLGLDVSNLTPENIKIDIDKAFDFIKRWKVSSKEKINQLIRFKVVNEIMNVEERRSVQKLAKINKKMKEYLEKKKKIEIKEKLKKEDFLVFSQSNYDTKDNTNTNLNTKEDKNTLTSKEIITETAKLKNTNPNADNLKDKAKDHIKIINNGTSFNNTLTLNSNNKIKETLNSDKHVEIMRSNSKNRPLSKRHAYQVVIKKDESKKKKIVFNSYNNAERIIRYIDNNESLKTNDNLVRHFNTFKYAKKFDQVTNSILKTEQLTVCSEADFVTINLVNTETQSNK